jgi:hypothetical protein
MAFFASNTFLIFLKETDVSAASEQNLQGLMLLDRMDASPSYLGIDTHCQKGFSEWFLFVTLCQIFSSILKMCSLMLRFKSLTAEKVCNGIRAFHEYS